jgi:hypothetical protein
MGQVLGPLTRMSSAGFPSTPASANRGPLCRHHSAGRDRARLGTRSFGQQTINRSSAFAASSAGRAH